MKKYTNLSTICPHFEYTEVGVYFFSQAISPEEAIDDSRSVKELANVALKIAKIR